MSKIYVLGAGTPTPTADRFGSSFVVEINGQHIMFDCGPAATHKLVKAGLWPTQIDHLFFTHHHFDHDVDYPCFLLCRWDQGAGRDNKLKVFGPTLTESITEKIIGENGAFAHDWKARVNHPVSQQVYVNRGGTLPRRPPEVDARDVGPGTVYTGPGLGGHRCPRRARPALARLPGLPPGDALREHRVYGRHPALRFG